MMVEDIVDRKVAAWRSLGGLCVQYGLIALTAGVVFSVAFSFVPIQNPFLEEMTEFVLFSAIFSFGFFGLRALNRRDIRKVSSRGEMAVAGLAAVGMSLPLVVGGILLTLFARPEYEGIEKWLPDIEDSQTYELRALQRLISSLKLSESVQERAEQLLEELRDRGLVRGRELRSMVAAVVYIAAREEGEPRTLEEISTITGVSQRELGKAYRFIGRNTDVRIVPPDPEEYINWFADKLDLEQDVRQRALELLEQAHEKEFISGKSPKGLAASALYLSAYMEGDSRTMNEVSDVLDVTTVTLRERSRDFVEELDLEDVPEHLIRDMEEAE